MRVLSQARKSVEEKCRCWTFLSGSRLQQQICRLQLLTKRFIIKCVCAHGFSLLKFLSAGRGGGELVDLELGAKKPVFKQMGQLIAENVILLDPAMTRFVQG